MLICSNFFPLGDFTVLPDPGVFVGTLVGINLSYLKNTMISVIEIPISPPSIFNFRLLAQKEK